MREIAPDLDVAEEPEGGLLRDALVRARHRLQLRVVGGDAEPNETPRSRQPLDHVDLDRNVRVEQRTSSVKPGRTGVDYGHTHGADRSRARVLSRRVGNNQRVRPVLAVCLVAALAGCAGSKKSEPKPLRIVGLALYDFEADLAPASISNGLARVYPTRDELERRARGARLVHCAPRVCFGYGGWYAFDRGPELTGRDIVPSSVRSQFDQNSSPVVTMQFTPRDRREFLRVTRREALRGRSRAARHGAIPQTLGLEQQDPACDLDYVPGAPRAVRPRVMLSTSAGFGGCNSTLVLEGL